MIWLDDSGVAQRLRELREDTTAWLGENFTGQFSLSGAQSKTALVRQDGRWGVPSGAIPTTHILKPAVAGLADHDLNEHLCFAAAARVGLPAAHSVISQFEDETAVVVDRYDRWRDPDDGLHRIHQEDVCQALGVDPERKYQSDGGPGPAEIASLLRAVMGAAAAEQAVWTFAGALIFNWIIGGTDAHAKNYSLLLAGGQVRLAPLYDLASSLPYGTHERKLRFAMKYGRSYNVELWTDPWPSIASELGLDAGLMLDRARTLIDAVPDAVSQAATATSVEMLERRLPQALTDAVADRARRCGAILS